MDTERRLYVGFGNIIRYLRSVLENINVRKREVMEQDTYATYDQMTRLEMTEDKAKRDAEEEDIDESGSTTKNGII